MNFNIEKNIPLTKSRLAGKYPFDSMEVSDSFLIENGTVKDQIRVTTARVRYQKKNPSKMFVTRKVDNGIRIWRLQ